MRDAVTVLGIIRERGRRGLPLEQVYRQLYNPALYLLAYGRIARNAGALTRGSTPETADGMSMATIERIIAALRQERYRWTPVRRISIPKAGSTRRRPLGIPTWSDKLLQEVIRLILEAYYEPQFNPHSHGFRPGRGCHTALQEIKHTWKGTAWFIEGDIRACFDSLDHEVLLAILGESIHDGRFLRLIRHLLGAGYLEDWTYHRTLSGTPQGGIVSPILANIYLDRLDRFITDELLPHSNRGTQRRINPAYLQVRNQAAWHARRGQHHEARLLRQQMQTLPSRDPDDPDYRRLRYIRYADDFLLGFNGPRTEAEDITQRIGSWLAETLKLELSTEKTLITHARSTPASFLGYEISVCHRNQLRDGRGQRTANGVIGLGIPRAVVAAASQPYLRHGKPIDRPERIYHTVFSIVAQYQQTYRGLAAYYQLAYNRSVRLDRLHWVMEGSLVKTLARKLGTSVRRVYRRYQASIPTDHGPRKGLEVRIERRDGRPPLVARWGGISLARPRSAVLNDRPARVWNGRTELLERLLAETCELCGSHEDIQVHHVRRLRDLTQPGRTPKPAWVQVMAARQRKTLIVCHTCHRAIHTGTLGTPHAERGTLESRMM